MRQRTHLPFGVITNKFQYPKIKSQKMLDTEIENLLGIRHCDLKFI